MENYSEKTATTKVITTFLALIVTFLILSLNAKTTYRQRSVLWEETEDQDVLISLWTT